MSVSASWNISSIQRSVVILLPVKRSNANPLLQVPKRYDSVGSADSKIPKFLEQNVLGLVPTVREDQTLVKNNYLCVRPECVVNQVMAMPVSLLVLPHSSREKGLHYETKSFHSSKS